MSKWNPPKRYFFILVYPVHCAAFRDHNNNIKRSLGILLRASIIKFKVAEDGILDFSGPKLTAFCGREWGDNFL